MQKIRKIAILGAGAMGAFFAGKFFDSGFSVELAARGGRLERLRKEGLVINGKPYFIPVVNPDHADSPADLIVAAVKNHQLKEAAAGLDNLVGGSTVIVSVMNGLESEEYIGTIYGMDKVLYAVSVGIDAVRENNRVVYSNPGLHYFGEAANDSISPKTACVRDAFESAGIRYEIPRDMIRTMWWKFMINAGMNQASSVMGAPYGVFQTDPDARGLMEALMQEVISLAGARNIDLSEQDLEKWYEVLNTLSPQGKTSMLQDIEAGRRTEVETFAGKVVELGEVCGVPVPVNRTVLQIIRVLESRSGPDPGGNGRHVV